ncbi:MAG: hypothetical protein FJ189_06315 [Gammaproteobacteria bacterium]|nr:hypothetical protein [Gammaproteobacteria bacterium]
MFRIRLEGFLAHPVQTSLLVADIGILMFLPIVRPPVVLSIVLIAGLVYLSMFFGATFAADRATDTTASP